MRTMRNGRGHVLPRNMSRRLLAAPLTALLATSLAVVAATPPAAATAAPTDQPAATAQAAGTLLNIGHHAGHWRIRPDVLPTLRRNLVAFYDFEHPVPGNPAQERDQGSSGTNIDLVNGGAAMRVRDGAYPSSRMSIQTQQLNPTADGNDDWKAGIYGDPGVPTLHAFNAVKQMSIMGWFKTTGQNPNLNTATPDPNDFFNAVGLAGVLTGNSQGHDVRALLEVINVNDVLHVVALGRRVDGSSSQTFAANEDWRTILPQGKWVFLTATFDFDNATMALYKNGRPLDGFYTLTGDPWGVAGDPEPDLTTASDPRGIKIGGSFPQNTLERNPCNCRFDGLMFLDRVASKSEVLAQYLWATHHRH